MAVAAPCSMFIFPPVAPFSRVGSVPGGLAFRWEYGMESLFLDRIHPEQVVADRNFLFRKHYGVGQLFKIKANCVEYKMSCSATECFVYYYYYFFEAKLCQGEFFIAQTVKGIILANLSDVVLLFLRACED